ncbi:MAG: molybdopterin-dependent oxidoreductase [Acidobacteria bacterium]|nr:molybdopterin-dependent oxidoreductase [Acidobacteriota bacterium]
MTRRTLLVALGGGLVSPSWAAPTLEEIALRGKERLILHSLRPLDLETPPALLDSWITPNSRFFVRTHFYIPQVDASRWRLSIEGLVEKPQQLTLEDLGKLPPVESVLTVECAGNWRAYFEPHVAGTQWRKGAVGTARWKGYRLRDVLARAGLKPEAKHLAFDGVDTGMATAPDFVRSVPLEKCLRPETIVATHMNGVPLPIEHGYPLRLITPGWEGAASVKWLTKITAIPDEVDGFFMKTAYRYPKRPGAPGAAVDPKDMAAITSLAVKSLITRPSGPVEGLAWAGEADVTRVEISTDGGSTWKEAKLGPEHAPFAWRRFRYDWKPASGQSATVMARATDTWGRTQPATPAWNPSGYLYNVPEAVRVGEPEKAESLPVALPEGEGRQVAAERCLACHDHKMIVSQHLDPGRWTREVEKMMRWGSPVSEKEKDVLVRYLAARFR